MQRDRGVAASRTRSVKCDEICRWFPQIVEFGERAAQRRGAAIGRWHGFLAVATEGAEHLVHVVGAVLREHAERVAGFVNQPGTLE